MFYGIIRTLSGVADAFPLFVLEEIMTDFKAAIFDLDGTLIDSMYVWEKVDRDFLTERGIEVTTEYTDAVRGMYFESAARYTIAKYGFKESVEQIIQIWLNMARYEYEHNVRLKPYAKEYLQYLRNKGVKTGLATSSNPYLLEPVLLSNGVNELFDAVCYTSQVGKNKRFPDIYLFTAKKLGVRPSECMVFEDITDGIDGANKAGMYTVAVFDKASESSREYLERNADKYICHFSEMVGKHYGT